jgi:DNA-binding response OmpR family regulator
MSSYKAGLRGGAAKAEPAATIMLGLGDAELRLAMSRYLGLVGYSMQTAATAAGLDGLLATSRPDMVILESHLPDRDGLAVVQRLRHEMDVGIILLTRPANLEERILGLSLGADQCLALPVQFRELEAVVRSLERRLRLSGPTVAAVAYPTAPRDIWGFDGLDWVLRTPMGATVRLTCAEHRALCAITEQPGQSVHRERIATALGKALSGYEDRSIDAVVARLRRKVRDATGETLPIRAARGIGYVFTAGIDMRRTEDPG